MSYDRSRAFARLCLTAMVGTVGAASAGPAMAAPVEPDPALSLSASALAAAVVPPRLSPVDPPAVGLVTNHVVIISIDGLRPDAIGKFGAETLQRLMREGSYSLDARTIMPSITLPSHTSMLTGETPEKHGIDWNRNETDEHGHVQVPTVFAEAHAAGFRTAAFFSKGKFHHLEIPNSLDHMEAPSGNDKWSADRTVTGVERYLASERPNLLFVHIGEPDYAGHLFSWMSTFYGSAVRKADRAVARVLDAADGAFGEGNYTVIVTADHGGHGWTHGSTDERDVTIPWIAWGRGVLAGTVLPDGIRTMDTTVTALWLLGLEPVGVGEAVETAFAAPPAPATLPLAAADGAPLPE